jgi:hypothetical protein
MLAARSGTPGGPGTLAPGVWRPVSAAEAVGAIFGAQVGGWLAVSFLPRWPGDPLFYLMAGLVSLTGFYLGRRWVRRRRRGG